MDRCKDINKRIVFVKIRQREQDRFREDQGRACIDSIIFSRDQERHALCYGRQGDTGVVPSKFCMQWLIFPECMLDGGRMGVKALRSPWQSTSGLRPYRPLIISLYSYMYIFLYVWVLYMGLGVVIRLRVPLYVQVIYNEYVYDYMLPAIYLSICLYLFIYIYS